MVGYSAFSDFSTSRLEARFLNDNGVWRDAPLCKGATRFEPLEDVRTIMITGGAGFIASWLVRHLVTTYPTYHVVCFDKLDYCASLNNTRMLGQFPNFSFYHGDITNPADVMSCLKQHNVDYIFHFAAQSHVDLSFGNSYSFTWSNVYGTHVLLECAKTLDIKRFIHVSTDEVYGEVDEDGEDLLETSILAPTNPYAASKAAAEMLVNAYHKSFKLPVIIVRSNNVYGPHQFPEKIIPKFTCLLQRGEKLVLHGDGKHTRRYLFAGDAADAFDTILHKGTINQIYNVGSMDEVSNLSLCEKLLGEFGLSTDLEGNNSWVTHSHDRPFNDRRYAVNGKKLIQLGWHQKTPFEEGLKFTVDWYRKYGETWWGNIDKTLTPFPIMENQAAAASSGQRAETLEASKTLITQEADITEAQRDLKSRQDSAIHIGSLNSPGMISPSMLSPGFPPFKKAKTDENDDAQPQGSQKSQVNGNHQHSIVMAY